MSRDQVRQSAKSGKENWRLAWHAYEASKGRAFWVVLPDRSTYLVYTKERKHSDLSRLYAKDKAMVMRVQTQIDQWERHADIIFNFHRHGILTFRQYPCEWDCGGHVAGYDWAAEKQIAEYSDCENDDKSFREGCMAYIADKKSHPFPIVEF